MIIGTKGTVELTVEWFDCLDNPTPVLLFQCGTKHNIIDNGVNLEHGSFSSTCTVNS